MAKRVKLNVGDVFEIPLYNGEVGYGRILMIDAPILFCEFYTITPSRKYTLEELKNTEVLLSIWCVNHGLSRREWTIIGNMPLDGEVKLPYFCKRDVFNPGRVFLVPGEYFMEEDEEAHSIVTTKENIGDAQPYGVFGHDAVRIRYQYELEQGS